MKKKVLPILLSGMLALSSTPIFADEAANETSSIILSEESASAEYIGSILTESSDGNPAVLLLFNYVNASSEPSCFSLSFFSTIYQSGQALELAYPDFDSEYFEYISNSALSIKDGASVQAGCMYKLADTTSPLEAWFYAISNFETPTIIPIALDEIPSELPSLDAPDIPEGVPGTYDELLALYLELLDKYTELENKYNALINASEPTSEESASTVPETVLQNDTSVQYNPGTHKVGTDMPAGEYVLFANRSSGYFSVSSDSTGSFDSIICNDNFSTFTILTVSDGQYLELSHSYAVPIENITSLDTTSSGTFKIGYHLPAGEYQLQADSDRGYYAVYSNSLNTFDSIITNNNFEGNAYVTVSDGQYLKLSRCHIIQ